MKNKNEAQVNCSKPLHLMLSSLFCPGKLHKIGKNIGQAINIEDNGNYSMYFVKGYNLMDLLSKNHYLCKKSGPDKTKHCFP